MAQSTNDVFPTSTRVAIIWESIALQKESALFAKSLRAKAKKFSKILKVGRTHLQDAVPSHSDRSSSRGQSPSKKISVNSSTPRPLLYEIGLGGTALGTGINTRKSYHKLVTRHLAKITKLPLKPTTTSSRRRVT
jgi:aspartate ammonia-lyase